MNAHKQGKTQALKGRDYFNPFSMESRKADWEDFERGYTEGLGEKSKEPVAGGVDLNEEYNFPPTQVSHAEPPIKHEKKWWEFWK